MRTLLATLLLMFAGPAAAALNLSGEGTEVVWADYGLGPGTYNFELTLLDSTFTAIEANVFGDATLTFYASGLPGGVDANEFPHTWAQCDLLGCTGPANAAIGQSGASTSVPTSNITPNSLHLAFIIPPESYACTPGGGPDLAICGFKPWPGAMEGTALFNQNSRYTLTLSQISGVPEPVTWLMMILGFGLAGWALRRRRFGPVRSPEAALA